MFRGSLVALMMLMSTSADAATYLLSWSGTDSRTFFYGGPGAGHETLTANETGSGYFDLIDNPTPAGGTANLKDFSFTTKLDFTIFAYPNSGGAFEVGDQTQTISYDAKDLLGFYGGYLAKGFGSVLLTLNAKTGSAGITEQFAGFSPGFATSTLSSGAASGLNPSGLLTITVAPLAAPEPSPWAMMIVGFGAIGSTMRRRKPAISFV